MFYEEMTRKHRIEYPGAAYHVLSRSNYRKELFLKYKFFWRFVNSFAADKQLALAWHLYTTLFLYNCAMASYDLRRD